MSNYIYNTLVSTERLQDVDGSLKQTWQTYLTGVSGLKLPVSGAQQQFNAYGAFSKTFNFYCDAGEDIEIGDKIIEDEIEYLVKEMQVNEGDGYANINHRKLIIISVE